MIQKNRSTNSSITSNVDLVTVVLLVFSVILRKRNRSYDSASVSESSSDIKCNLKHFAELAVASQVQY